MSVAIDTTPLSASPTWRQFRQAIACVALAILVGCGIYAIETLLLHCRHRFVESPVDVMTRAVGLAHFSIGWLFLFTSPRLRNGSAALRLAGWTLIGVAFCAAFSLGGDKNPLGQLAFLSFFFVHEVHDEAMLFRQSGHFTSRPSEDRFVHSLCTSVALGMATMLAGFYILRGHFLARTPIMHDLPMLWLLLGWTLLALATAFAGANVLRAARLTHGSVAIVLLGYRPLLAIYACLAAILLVGSMFGSVGVSLIILIHGMTWLVHTCQRLRARPVPASGVWSWLRQTPAGFLTLHLAAILAVLVLFALRTHLWQRSGVACQLLSSTWFPYWSIMHIAMAFGRPR